MFRAARALVITYVLIVSYLLIVESLYPTRLLVTLSSNQESILVKELLRDEGFSRYPYLDTTRHLAIAYGRNLETSGVSQDEGIFLLKNDLRNVERGLLREVPAYRGLDSTRKRVMLNMGYNLGVQGLLKFKLMLEAVEAQDFHTAAQQMRKSLWATQVKGRAERLAMMMELGDDE